MKKEFQDETDPRFKETKFVIEATDAERHFLWADNDRARRANESYAVKWEEISMGLWIQIGELDKRPICLTFTWARLDGILVMFWDCCSQVADHAMIDRWLAQNCTPAPYDRTRPASTNATNFHHCIHFVKDEAKKAEVTV